MRWTYFGAACVLAGSIVHLLGAPLSAIVAGVALAVLWKAFRDQRRHRYEAG